MISIKTKQEINIMREGGRILAKIMAELEKMTGPGVSGKDLDRAGQALVFEYGAEPGFKGYQGFPNTLCVSINSMLVHAVPTDYKLQEGDIVSLDLGIKYKGFYSDMAITLPVRRADLRQNSGGLPSSSEATRMIKVAKKALKLGIKKARQGNFFGDIGNTMQRFIEYQGFGVVRDLCGHGIGKELHEEPQIPNFGKRRAGKEIKPGMVFCIEPMITMGDYRLVKSTDNFGFETKDGSLSAHFEHTIAITPSGNPEILTLHPKPLPKALGEGLTKL